MNIDRMYYEFDDANYMHIRDSMANYLKEQIDYFMWLHEYKRIIILCIGTNMIKDDSYGPIIGTSLHQPEFTEDIRIFGTMQNTLNATNIESFICKNASIMDESLVIAIDSAVSEYYSIGSIIVKKNGLKPGSGSNKLLPKIGNISITGITSNDSDIYDIKNMDIVKYIEGNINIKKLKQMCNITVDALLKALRVELNFDKKINECIKQLENKRAELEKNLEDFLTSEEKKELKRLHYKMNK